MDDVRRVRFVPLAVIVVPLVAGGAMAAAESTRSEEDEKDKIGFAAAAAAADAVAVVATCRSDKLAIMDEGSVGCCVCGSSLGMRLEPLRVFGPPSGAPAVGLINDMAVAVRALVDKDDEDVAAVTTVAGRFAATVSP